jgi:hypothetical protein
MPSGSIALRTKEEDCDDDIAGKQFSACGPFFSYWSLMLNGPEV